MGAGVSVRAHAHALIKTICNHAKDCPHNRDSSLAVSACVCQLIFMKRSNSWLDKDKINILAHIQTQKASSRQSEKVMNGNGEGKFYRLTLVFESLVLCSICWECEINVIFTILSVNRSNKSKRNETMSKRAKMTSTLNTLTLWIRFQYERISMCQWIVWQTKPLSIALSINGIFCGWNRANWVWFLLGKDAKTTNGLRSHWMCVKLIYTPVTVLCSFVCMRYFPCMCQWNNGSSHLKQLTTNRGCLLTVMLLMNCDTRCMV